MKVGSCQVFTKEDGGIFIYFYLYLLVGLNIPPMHSDMENGKLIKLQFVLYYFICIANSQNDGAEKPKWMQDDLIS